MRVLIFFLWLMTGIVTGVVASDKGHGFGSWALAGFLLGPIGLIAAAGLSDQKLRGYISRTIQSQFIQQPSSNQKFLEQMSGNVDSKPKLLNESQTNFKFQGQEYLNEKYIGDFLLIKSASEDQVWIKILELIEFRRPDAVGLADRSQSNSNISLTGGSAYLICKSNGERFALAYAKESADAEVFYWQLRVY